MKTQTRNVASPTIASTKKQSAYYVVIVITKYKNFEEARSKEPGAIAEHIARSKQLHDKGVLLMAGAFLDDPSTGPLSTMGVLTSREAAEEYLREDPFVKKGMVAQHYIRKWANMFA
jgi:uncharacterized protein